MALSLEAWELLPQQEKEEIIRFLQKNCRIDLEHPKSNPATAGSYPISNGITSGNHIMKWGEEYRIYIKSLNGIPPFLDAELKERGTKNRIGGSNTIKAIMKFGKLKIGNN